MFDKNSKLYIAATAGGNQEYSISYHKPQGRPGYVSSLLVERNGNIITYAIIFRAKPGEYRSTLQGPATPKKITAAFAEVIAALKAGGYIAADFSADAINR